MEVLKLWSEEVEYRRSAFRFTLIVIAVAATVFTVFNWSIGLKSYALIELVLALLSLGILSFVRRTQYLHNWTLVFLFVFYGVILLGISFASFRSGLFAWIFVFPILSYLLLGRRTGQVVTFTYVSLGLAILGWRLWIKDPDVHTIAMANYGMCVAAIWGVAHVYESKREQVVERLQNMAAKDPLTGLYNRLHLESVFEQVTQSESRSDSSLFMLLIDLDHFKSINDNYGHEVGDKVLVLVAELIKQTIGENDWGFRVGGEEFCLLLADSNQASAHDVAQRLQQAIEGSVVNVDEHEVSATVSIGIARWPGSGTLIQTLYRSADRCLYKAKERGRNCVVFESS
ncbi:GGDEF domain-containing protein [Shewanella atlantica]|uniref:diguanylate cyclase n=1 Tax=Shewanella atlantica TaxID=271099 RepID=A0A431W8I2_9GAMM|nr:GGDEF domain-containing protein [Shewanella atlantica]RTR31618.1 GGDEF domain-containing protein [Shewanella atlantica]